MNDDKEMIIQKIPLDKVDDNHQYNYARGEITPGTVSNLMKSISDNGLIQPIVVKQIGDTYRVIAGFRRTTACKLLGWKEIDAVIKVNINELDGLFLNLEENLQRENLNKLQEAKAVQKIQMMDPTLNEFEIAKRLGQGRGWVQVRKYILELPVEIQEDIAKDLMPIEHIRKCWQLPTKEQQYEFVKKIKERKFRGEKIHLQDIQDEVLQRGKSSTKKVKNKEEIFQLQQIVRENLGNNLATRCLAWAAGEIPNHEILNDIRKHCEHAGVLFEDDPTFGR